MTDSDVPTPAAGVPPRPWGMDVPTYCMLLHFSQFAGYVIPMAGLVLPIVMWATNKQLDPRIDAHGKVIFNWMLSCLVYALICIPLCFVLIGIFMLLALGLCSLIFVVIAAIKANDDVLWKYPMSISFFKV